MLMILWFLFIAIASTSFLAWLLDNNGLVLIQWFGFEIRTDMFTVILLAALFSLLIFCFAYLVARIAAIKFPNLLKILFKKSHFKHLEALLKRHNKAFEIMAELLLSLEVGDNKSSQILQQKFAKLTKRSALNNFFLAKIAQQSGNYQESTTFYEKFGENQHAMIMALKTKFDLAISTGNEISAIAYAKQIIANKNNNLDVAKTLFSLYKIRGMWPEAKSLIKEYGQDYFKQELQNHDLAVMNTSLAFEAYREKKFFNAIKYANLALKKENNFLPAIEVKLKSWLKLGFIFKVRWHLKGLWRENPHLIFAEIFDLTHRKSSANSRISAIKKLVKTNENVLGKLAVGLVAFRVGNYSLAQNFLNSSIAQEKTYRAYKILSFVHKALGNKEEQEIKMKKAEMLNKDDHYTCNSCGHLSSLWSSKCNKCDSYDSLEWNY